MFYCEYYEIFKNAFFIDNLRWLDSEDSLLMIALDNYVNFAFLCKKYPFSVTYSRKTKLEQILNLNLK